MSRFAGDSSLMEVLSRLVILTLCLAGCSNVSSSSDAGIPPDAAVGADGSVDGSSGGGNDDLAPSGPGATPVFDYPDGFTSTDPNFKSAWEAKLVGSAMDLTYAPDGNHRGGSAWYEIRQNIESFTTDFTFQQDATSVGMTFCVQNTTPTTNTNYGTGAVGDANGDGYGAYSFQPNSAIDNSVAIAFDLGAYGEHIAFGAGHASVVTLFLNGAPYQDSGAIPVNDFDAYGIDLTLGHPMSAHVVYDGSLLTMLLVDTVTKAQARYTWPVDIPAATTSKQAWIGFTGGTVVAATQSVLTWRFATGYAPRLATPELGVAPGSYASAQSVTLTSSSGATIYYTTNGLVPTSASTKYTGPIPVSTSQIIQAVAVQDGFTDSLVAMGNYQIATSGTSYPIDASKGFAANDGVLLVGYAQRNGTAIRLTDTNPQGQEDGAAWFATPVPVQKFSTTFTMQWTSAMANGMAFVIQNQTDPSLDTVINSAVSGGPTALGHINGLGYAGLESSVAVVFDVYDSNTTGLYTNGAKPSTAPVTVTGVTLASGNPLIVKLDYDGTTLSMTITDTKTKGSFSKGWPIDIPKTVGASTAYVGFTGSTGGQYANQDVLSWTYTAN